MGELTLHEIRMIPIDSLKRDKSNPNVMSKEQLNGLRESFRRWGYLDPVIVNEDFLIADGEHRADIYREFGRKEIPCYVLKLTETERRLLRQTKNKLHGEHEPKADALELKLLFDAGELPNLSTLIAQDSEDLMRLLQKHDLVPFVQEDSIPEVKEARVKRGEIWQLGNHRLMCSDCTKRQDVRMLVSNSKPVLCLTDPPYSLSYETLERYPDFPYTAEKHGEPYKDPVNVQALLDGFFANAQAPVIVFSYAFNKHLNELSSASQKYGYAMLYELVWLKPHFSFVIGRRYQPIHEPILVFRNEKLGKGTWNVPSDQSTVFAVNNKAANEIHPTEKPLELWGKLVDYHSNHGETIYDPFGGSGTTLIACEQMGRICLMMEIDPWYCTVIIDRWQKLTGQSAERISEGIPA